MPEATTLEAVRPVVKSSDALDIDAYITPQEFQSALSGLRAADNSYDPGLPVLELTDSKPVVTGSQQSGETAQTQTSQPGGENAEQSSPDSKEKHWWQRNWDRQMPAELQQHILCWEIKRRLGVSCDALKINSGLNSQ